MRDVGLSIDGKPILKAINWEVRRGENWVVVGPNGAGKTSLLRLINGYHWPTTGKVRVLGKQFGGADLRELRKEIGLVSPYVTDWIPDNQRVLDVVFSGKFASIGLWVSPSDVDKRFAVALLRRMGCGRYASNKFGTLSQGEKQKVVIARALMARPRLLTLDEPCSGLDLAARERFLKAISNVAVKRNPSMVYITHRIEEIPRGFTHAILMRNGRVLKRGKMKVVLTDEYLSSCFGVGIRVKRLKGRYYALVDA